MRFDISTVNEDITIRATSNNGAPAGSIEGSLTSLVEVLLSGGFPEWKAKDRGYRTALFEWLMTDEGRGYCEFMVIQSEKRSA